MLNFVAGSPSIHEIESGDKKIQKVLEANPQRLNFYPLGIPNPKIIKLHVYNIMSDRL